MSSSSAKFGRIAWAFAWEELGRSFVRPTAPRAFHLNFAFPQARQTSQYNVRRQCSGGLLLLGLDASTTTTPAQTIASSCNTAAESALVGNSSRHGTISRLARQTWIRTPHNISGSAGRVQKRWKHTPSEEKDTPIVSKEPSPQPEARHKDAEPTKKDAPEGHESLSESVSKYLHLPHLPKMPHRPTKEELLAAATGFGERLKVRFKWFSIRSTRPFNADEWGAFVSWILFGHFVWILVGTTTFVSLLILMVNTVFAQGTHAWISSCSGTLVNICTQKLLHSGSETT